MKPPTRWHRLPGPVPGIHDFAAGATEWKEGVDRRVKPGCGDLALCPAHYGQPPSANRTAVPSPRERGKGIRRFAPSPAREDEGSTEGNSAC